MNIADLKVIVFDFDGTLIDSQKMKLESFYDLFPPDQLHQNVVAEVLGAIPEESRYLILADILGRIGYEGSMLEAKISLLAQRYDRLVMRRLKKCREMPGATSLLQAASKIYNLYLSSNTPQESLPAIIRHRRWFNHFKGIFGYPQKKDETLYRILEEEQIQPEQLIVVGDGQSDRLSSQKTGCGFYGIKTDQSLLELAVNLSLHGVMDGDRR